MKNTLVNLTRLSILAVIMGLVAGCAGVTKEELDSVRATAETALSEARAAKDEAAQASSASQEEDPPVLFLLGKGEGKGGSKGRGGIINQEAIQPIAAVPQVRPAPHRRAVDPDQPVYY